MKSEPGKLSTSSVLLPPDNADSPDCSDAEKSARRLNALGGDEVVPLQLQLGSERVEVWIDRDGLHFRQPGQVSAVGHLPWERAIAMSLVPEEWRPLLPSA